MSGWFNQKTGYVFVDLNAYARTKLQQETSASRRALLIFLSYKQISAVEFKYRKDS